MLTRQNVQLFVADLIENARKQDKTAWEEKGFIAQMRTRHPAMVGATVEEIASVVTLGELLDLMEATGD